MRKDIRNYLLIVFFLVCLSTTTVFAKKKIRPPLRSSHRSTWLPRYRLQKDLGDFHIKIRRANWFENGKYGAFPLKIEIENKYVNSKLLIRIIFQNQHQISRQVFFGNLETREIEIPIPYYFGSTKKIEFVFENDSITLPFYTATSFQPYNNEKIYLLALGNGFDLGGLKDYNNKLKRKYREKVEVFTCPDSNLPQTLWPYFSTSLIITDHSYYMGLSEERKLLLEKWLACGGFLVIFNSPTKESGEHNNSFIIKDFLVTGSQKLQLHKSDGILYSQFLKGTVCFLNNDPFTGNAKMWKNLIKFEWPGFLSSSVKVFNQATTGKKKNLFAIPMKTFLVLLTLFVILIGPGNYLFLKKNKAEIFFVLTVPIISFVTIIFILIFILANDGLSHRGRYNACSIINNQTGISIDFIEQNIYLSGWANPDFFLAGESIFLLDNPSDTSPRWRYSYYKMRNIFLNFETAGLRLNSDWADSRVLSRIQKIEISNRRYKIRVEILTKGEKYKLTNQTGYDIEKFLFFTPGLGKYFFHKTLFKNGDTLLIDGKMLRLGGLSFLRKSFPVLKNKGLNVLKNYTQSNTGVYVLKLLPGEKNAIIDSTTRKIKYAEKEHEILGFY
ncbi:hypothetical protein ACFL35_17545 [Candidatus Riflebacteria bacterium]